MQYLEEQIKLAGLKRIELGVFEFELQPVRLERSQHTHRLGDDLDANPVTGQNTDLHLSVQYKKWKSNTSGPWAGAESR